MISAIVALTASHPVDYEDLGVGLHLPDSPASNGPNNGVKYDTGIFDRYADDKHELEYVPPAIGEMPFEGMRERREIIPSIEHGGTFNLNSDLFASLHDYIRPERDTDSNETDIKVPLHGIVHAVETTLLNSVGRIDSAHNNSKLATTEASAVSTALGHVDDDRKERSIEVLSTAKTDDVDELTDKDLKVDVSGAEEGRSHHLTILAPIVFSPSIRDREASATSTSSTEDATAAELADATPEPFPKNHITLIKSTNTTKVIPRGDVFHVQHQQIQQSIFHSNLAILPTVTPDQVNIPQSSKANDGSSEEADDSSETKPDCNSSNEESGEDKGKCEKPETTTEDRQAIKEELAKKAQKLKEQVAEIKAEPIILSQGI